MREKSLDYQKKVVLSGNSAGGMGTFIWSNFLRDVLPSSVKLYSMPDSGFFLDFFGPGSNFHETILSVAKVGLTSKDLVEP